MLIEKKANLKKIQTLMGHTNIETTLNVYGHLLEDERTEKMTSLLGCSAVYSTILVAYLWRVKLKLLNIQTKILLRMQNVAGSNPVTRPL